MKTATTFLGFVTLLAAFCVNGQGTLIFDQQSSTDETPPIVIGGGLPFSDLAPTGTGQSFTPGLTSIGFIRLMFADANTGDGLGASVFINLRSGSIDGPIIGSTAFVRMDNGFRGVTTFLFATPITLTGGVQYYFEPLELANTGVPPNNGPWNIAIGQYNYAGGDAYNQGSLLGAQDYWFREGIVVPEPSSVALLVVGAAFMLYRRINKR